jgi:hypothetical protein
MHASIVTATREEYIGHGLEAAIRSRVQDRRWYRRNRDVFAWADFERENDVFLRELFEIRRDAIRQYRAERIRMEQAYRSMRAAHEAAEWRESVRLGEYVDIPLADPGDIFVHPAGVGQ